MPPLEVLYEDNHLLVVVKPPGIATMGVPGDTVSLLTIAKDYIKRRYHKPGNVYLGIVSRLDVPVSGVVLIARTSKAASRLTEQFRTRSVEKLYWAIVEGVTRPPSAQWVDWVAHDERHRRMHIVGQTHPGAKEARLHYRQLHQWDDRSLIEVELHTGRKHQIRLQAAHHGHPILGDRKYGSRSPFPVGIALHARQLTVTHPVTADVLRLDAPPPKSWESFGVGPNGPIR